MNGWQTLLYKEVLRFWKVSFQTVAAPVLTAVLYLMVFGHVLDERVQVHEGVSYTAFLIPGLVMMSVLQNAFANSSSSLIQSKIMGNLVFLLLTPLSHRAWFVAYVGSSMVRGLVVGLGVLIVTSVFALPGFVAPLWIVVFAALGASMLGGSISVPPSPCTHAPARAVRPWTGEEGTAGTVSVVGAGKMGRAVEAALLAKGHTITREIDLGQTVVEADRAGSDVAFEFTEPGAAAANVSALLMFGIPVVCGTTGWDPAPARRLAGERRVAFLHAANYSLGVAAARRAGALVARMLAPFPEYEPGLVERHHSAKKDAPSGTAKLLAAEVAAARGGGAVPIVSLRQGGQPGEHAIIFEGPDESLEIVHRARSRALFAAGAVAAAEWLVSQRPQGPVSFDDFLDFVLSRERSVP